MSVFELRQCISINKCRTKKNNKGDRLHKILLRILRDKPMPARKFLHVFNKVRIEKCGTTDQAIRSRGLQDFLYKVVIGDVSNVNGVINYLWAPYIVKVVDDEIKKKKYKDYSDDELNFTIAYIELIEILKYKRNGII